MSFLPGHSRLPTLDTPRLRLRWLADHDLPALNALHADARSMQYWGEPPWADAARAARWLAAAHDNFQRRELLRWGIAERASDRVIGLCSLQRLDAARRYAEVGYMLASPAWGQGYAREAVGRLLEFAWGELGLAALGADCHPANSASLRLLAHLGFTRKAAAGDPPDLYGLARPGVAGAPAAASG